MSTAKELAREIEGSPARLAEVKRHYEAIIGALNESHVDGEQDALCVFEAVSLATAQLIANFPDDARVGVVNYILARTLDLADVFDGCGKGAAVFSGQTPITRGGGASAQTDLGDLYAGEN